MGYTTDFTGEFLLDHPLSLEHARYLARFAGTRRMKRNAAKTSQRTDPMREAVGLPAGLEGGYFVGEGGFAGQGDHTNQPPDIVDYNSQPQGQPSLWCQWVPATANLDQLRLLDAEIPKEQLTDENVYDRIMWNGSEKFYDYVEWITYILTHFLAPWGYALNGTIEWQGEETMDKGRIIIENNQVRVQRASVSWR